MPRRYRQSSLTQRSLDSSAAATLTPTRACHSSHLVSTSQTFKSTFSILAFLTSHHSPAVSSLQPHHPAPSFRLSSTLQSRMSPLPSRGGPAVPLSHRVSPIFDFRFLAALRWRPLACALPTSGLLPGPHSAPAPRAAPDNRQNVYPPAHPTRHFLNPLHQFAPPGPPSSPSTRSLSACPWLHDSYVHTTG